MILEFFFALNASCRFGKIHIHVDRDHASSGVGASLGGRASCLSTAAASANSVRRGAPCRSTAAPSVPSASGSQIVRTVDVEDDAEIGDQSPQDDEDELMFPELVDRCSKQAMEDQYMEDIAFGARFDDTDDEEKNENNDNLVLADYEGDDLPTIEWNREDPQLAPGTVFQTMMDLRNAITTFCLRSKNNYEVIKSEPGRFTVKCPYKRCRWRLHASTMRRSTLVQIKKNDEVHRCPPRGGEPEVKSKLAKTRWLADAILDWLRETLINVPYMRMFYEKEMALDRINGPWNESFQLLYTFKAEVEMASPGSVVAIDKHTVPYKLKSGKLSANFEEQMAEEKAQASQKKKNKKEGKRKVDTGNIPGRVTRNLLMMNNTKTAAVPTVVIDATNIEAIAYNIALTAQIHHSMSEPVDVSLPLPSSDPLMKDTKTAAVPTVVIDATNIEAIAYNIASTAQIQHSMSEPVDVSLPLPSSDPLLMKAPRRRPCQQWSSMPRTLKSSPTTSL
ncbi:hypothetical protein QYE76_054154 [Lolium multiflorum]|uniref:Transposase MuDR plant domain-containing protein n=1 Tax=Lolium multiflorum TaxID=4521 RepID=A0AAD8WN89_LOLMU|nr:hypothetical protein QYE76_054154 [Lolium multiflorum]